MLRRSTMYVETHIKLCIQQIEEKKSENKKERLDIREKESMERDDREGQIKEYKILDERRI
jgi:hypothetical protein